MTITDLAGRLEYVVGKRRKRAPGGHIHYLTGEAMRAEQVPLFNFGPSLWDRQHRAASILEIARGLGPNIGLECTADGWRFIVIDPETREALRLLDAAEDPLPPLQRRDAALRRGEAEDLLAATRAILRDVQAENEIAALREAS